MRNYTATFNDSNGNEIQKKNFEAKNLIEASKLAQQFKRINPKIKKAGRVKTIVKISEEDQKEMVLKKTKRLIKESEKLVEEYKKYQNS